MNADWHVYIVRCADQTLYTGIARDVAARIAAHNAGKGASYTRARRPVELVHREPASDRGAALRREAAIKRLPPAGKRRLFTGQVQVS
jgi:putative endonuclease